MHYISWLCLHNNTLKQILLLSPCYRCDSRFFQRTQFNLFILIILTNRIIKFISEFRAKYRIKYLCFKHNIVTYYYQVIYSILFFRAKQCDFVAKNMRSSEGDISWSRWFQVNPWKIEKKTSLIFLKRHLIFNFKKSIICTYLFLITD